MPQSRRISRMRRAFLAFAGVATAVIGSLPTSGQSSARDEQITASSDSAIYAAFFETLNRIPSRDTIFVEDQSVVFQGISPHYDSVAPGLATRLVALSAPPRPTAGLYLPPPIVIISATTSPTQRERAMNGPSGQAPNAAQGVRGVWQLSPIAYSRDGREAMFYYRLVCGTSCSEQTLVWVAKNSKGGWDIKRTAILDIS